MEAFCEAQSLFICGAGARHGAGREADVAMAQAAEAPGGQTAFEALGAGRGKAEESAYSAIHMLLLDAYPGWKKDGAAHSSSETCDISATVIERGENDDAY